MKSDWDLKYYVTLKVYIKFKGASKKISVPEKLKLDNLKATCC